MTRNRTDGPSPIAVLFDFNGVLVDDEPIHSRLVCELAAERSGIIVTHDVYFQRYTGIPDRECFEAVWRDSGRELDDEELNELVAEKARRYLSTAAQGHPFFPGAVELVRRAAAMGPIGIVSGALRPEVELALERAGLAELTDVVVTAEDVPRGKPDPAPYLTALKALQDGARRVGQPPVQASCTLAVEDTEPGVTAARAAGLRVLALGHTSQPARLRAADVFVPSIADVDLERIAQSLFGQ